MGTKGFAILFLRFFLGLVLGFAVRDKDVWSSSVEKMGSLKNHEVRFNGSAKHWTDALPIGNGRLGAMIWGSLANETINLNEDTLWTGTPRDYTNPDAPNSLSEVRKLVENGRFPEATAAAVNLSGNASAVYQLLGDIKLEFDSHATYDEETYQRVLDLHTATVTVRYIANEVEYIRERFASNPDNIIAIKISGNKPASLNFTVYLDSQLHHHSYVNEKNQIIMKGNCQGSPKGIQYSSVLDLQISPTSELRILDGRKLHVEGCDWAVILFAASSSFDGPFTNPVDSKKDPYSESLDTIDLAKRYSYSDLFTRHVNDYQALFHRVSLQLSNNSGSMMKNDSNLIITAQRVQSLKFDEDPSLVELLFQYGRYLMTACSRPGTQVSNL